MPIDLEKAKGIVSKYIDFPGSSSRLSDEEVREYREDIIRSVYGPKIRGKLVSKMSDQQVYRMAERIYGDASQTIEKSRSENPIRNTSDNKIGDTLFEHVYAKALGASQTVKSGLENNIDPVLDPSIKSKGLDDKVKEEQTFLFDNSPRPYQG